MEGQVSVRGLEGFREYCSRRGLASESVEAVIPYAVQFARYLESSGRDIESAIQQDVREYFADLMIKGPVSSQAVRAVILLGLFARNDDVATYAISRLSANGVMQALKRRVEEVADRETYDAVFKNLELPPLSSPPEAHAAATRELVRGLDSRVDAETCRHLLTCNAHNIPLEAFADEKERYQSSSSVDEYLSGRHDRLVDELVRSVASGDLWYEQRITPAVVEYVRDNPEIQSGVREGRTIYVAKIPYAPQAYLDATDPAMKRYHACHCPVARESILTRGEEVPPVFCYCSGGFEKLPFDVIFGQPVQVKVLESVLAGDVRCRFAITIPDSVDVGPR